jgi:hypothetical protein
MESALNHFTSRWKLNSALECHGRKEGLCKNASGKIANRHEQNATEYWIVHFIID